MLSLIKRWYAQSNAPIAPPSRDIAGEEIAGCLECARLLRVRYTLRFITHLRYHHKMSENVAIDTAVKVSEAIYAQRTRING